LEDIFTGASVTTGAFFHHFSTKEDLGFAVINSHMEKRRQDLEGLLLYPQPHSVLAQFGACVVYLEHTEADGLGRYVGPQHSSFLVWQV